MPHAGRKFCIKAKLKRNLTRRSQRKRQIDFFNPMAVDDGEEDDVKRNLKILFALGNAGGRLKIPDPIKKEIIQNAAEDKLSDNVWEWFKKADGNLDEEKVKLWNQQVNSRSGDHQGFRTLDQNTGDATKGRGPSLERRMENRTKGLNMRCLKKVYSQQTAETYLMLTISQELQFT